LPSEQHSIRIVTDQGTSGSVDFIAIESPFQIRLSSQLSPTAFDYSMTMRSPGDDLELALGHLFTDGVISSQSNAEVVDQKSDRIHLRLKGELAAPTLSRAKNRFVNSACGLCALDSVQAIEDVAIPKLSSACSVSTDAINRLTQVLTENQSTFRHTGGVHASALFNSLGELIALREDVGRHNALDKLIGAMLLKDKIPLRETILLVSGRVSYELTQKALMAGIPILAAIGAPSTMAIQLAEDFGQTLIGFLRPGRFNIYSGFERVQTGSLSPPGELP
jgi:FdhD protein